MISLCQRFFVSELTRAEQEKSILKLEINDLKEENQRINMNIAKTQGSITKCQLTGLYNEMFFKQYLKNKCESKGDMDCSNTALILISIDELQRIKTGIWTR